MTRVKVDFNSRGPHGWVRGSERRADGPLDINDLVILFDADEHLEYEARVADKDTETGRVLFEVLWRDASAHGVYIASGSQGAHFVMTPDAEPVEAPQWDDQGAGVRVSLAV